MQVLFIMQCKVVISFEKATEQYFPLVQFVILYKMVLTFDSVDEILKFDHSNGSYLINSTFFLVLFIVYWL